jgi:hypothetical protein
MTGFVVILAALQFAVPVHCYPTEPAWQQAQQNVGVSYMALAFYDYNPPQRIAVGPDACRHIRRPTQTGANILAHELAHHWQYRNNRPFDETEADRIANRTDDQLLRRLERALGRRAPAIVTLAP